LAGTSNSMTAGTSITNNDSVNSGTSNSMTAGTSITNNGSVNSGTANSMTAGMSITNNGSVNSGTSNSMTAGTSITNNGSVNSGMSTSMTAGSDITNKSLVEAGTTVDFKAKNGTITNEKQVSGTNVAMTVENSGNIVNNGVVTAKTDDVNLSTETGNITNTDTVTGAKNVTMNTKNGKIKVLADVVATTGNADLEATTGRVEVGSAAKNVNVNAGSQVIMKTASTTKSDIEIYGDLSGTKGINLSTQVGDIIWHGHGTSTTGSIKETTGNGAITGDNGSLSAGQDITLTTTDGTITESRTLEAGGNIGLTTNTGAITTNAAAKAGTDLTLNTTNGDITTNGTLDAGEDIALLTTKGNISGNGAQTAGQDLIWQARSGDLTVNGKLKAGRYLTLTTDKGKITTTAQGELAADEAMNVTTGEGDINLNADATSGGLLNIEASRQGNITSAAGTLLSSTGSNANIYTNQGNVNLYDVYALKDAAAGTKDGSVTIHKIDGENVLVTVKNPQDNMNIGQIVAGKGVYVTSDKIDISNVGQRQGYDNMLLLSPRASEDGPMDYLNINNINPNLGLEIDQLWTHMANLHVNNQKFYLDRLSILDLANLSNIDTTTQVWGSAPVRNPVNTSYWYDPSNRHPWMNLYFTDRPHTQLSNGLLLRYDDFYYVYNQRYSAVNTQFENLTEETALRQMHRYDKQEKPGYTYGMYERYDLLDFSPDLLGETGTEDTKITIQ
jgi:hypothetical protein